MTLPTTDPDVVAGHEAALSFMRSRDPRALKPLKLPGELENDIAETMARHSTVPHINALMLRRAAGNIAVEGNPGLAMGALSVLAKYWRTSNETECGEIAISAGYACNRAGWYDQTLAIASDPAPVGGPVVAVHLAILAAEAFWHKGDYEAARRYLTDTQPAVAKHDAVALWHVMRDRLDALAQRAEGVDTTLEKRWKKLLEYSLASVKHRQALSTAVGIDLFRVENMRVRIRLERLQRFLEAERDLPPADEAEFIRRDAAIVQAFEDIGDLLEDLG